MTRARISLLALAIWGLGVMPARAKPSLAPSFGPPPSSLRDVFGQTLPARPCRRVVSLAPSVTETLFAAGFGDRVVGVSRHSDFPREARRLPVVGDADHVSTERLVTLHPDLVLAVEGAGIALDRLQRLLHVPVVVLPGDRLDAPARHAEALAPFLGPSGRDFARRYRRDVARVKSLPAGGTALWVIWHRPIMVAGTGTYLDDLLRHLGVVNLALRPGYALYPDERLVSLPPTVVLYPDDLDIAPVRARVQHARFISLPADLASRPGPRLPALLSRVARELTGKP